MRIKAVVTILMILMWHSGAVAQNTPNHVFQKTEEIRILLDRLNDANFTEPPTSLPQVEKAMPRHVLQLSRDVWRKTQLLRFMNGLPTKALPPLPPKEITPGDVLESVTAIHLQVVELLPAYGLDSSSDEVPLPKDKSPTDVLRNLVRLSGALDTMGVPATVPNDVYQMAQSVLLDVSALARRVGINSVDEIAASVPVQSGKVPADALREAIALAEDLSSIVQASDRFAVKGGIVVPNKSTDGATPADVIQVIARLRADVNAIRVAVKDTTDIENAPYVGGMTPTHVVTSVMRARALVAALSNASSS